MCKPHLITISVGTIMGKKSSTILTSDVIYKQIKDYANRAEKREGAQIQMQIEEKLGVVQVGSAPHYWIILHP